MARKGPNIQAFNKQFPDDDSCLEHLMRVRYGERLTCLGCQKQATYYRVRGRRSYVCEHCGYQVYPTAGTPFESTRTSLRDWFFVMFLFCASRNGVAAIGGPGKTVEADETFIGGKDTLEEGDDKAIVFGIVERGGDVLTRHVL